MSSWSRILFFGLLSLSFNSFAIVGTITEQVQTPATIQRAKQTLPGTKGAGVEMDDAINTRQGKVGIVFADQTKVQVNENSKLIIDDFVYDPKKPAVSKLALNMASGTVRYASGAIAHNNSNAVAINTPTATVGVRGTDFTATVDELGESTVILLPSCPRQNLLPDEIEKYCVTGVIEVHNEAGTVTLDRPFQATKVVSRSIPPTKPVTLHLSEDAIGNLLILAPPFEITQARREQQAQMNHSDDALSQNFLKGVDLGSVLAEQNAVIWQTDLSKNYLDQDFLMSLLDIMNAELSALFGNLLAPVNPILPDYKPGTGEKATINDALGTVELCRTDSVNNISCVTTPKTQNSTVTQSQSGGVVIINRINQGGNTFITTKQN